ncbi:MFS transporter [[Mycobacterium] crassicus]|uniref:MFS transporter n=1 Tax=[Mycobacterium] crassicus TaxID=2872309 RepID=A0ABU5XQW3_9MYCO|nr:MFS transporter [Mycolicibacter sp. MYC098]MEB3024147.1 MFS transporter [Mycolicibacter sp. MYC098]
MVSSVTAVPMHSARHRSPKSRVFPWLVFALTFALLLSDYMSRQVLSAVFPVLKAEWALTDANLASLSSAVALMVGILAVPLSLVADRWGRVRSLVLMVVIWSAATLMCALATSFHQMLLARFIVGVGEAAYGSVGIAVVLSIFAPRVHAALSGAFIAGGSFGSMVGVALGGLIAVHLGWRWAFAAMAIFGLILVTLFRALVSEAKIARHAVGAGPVDSECRVPSGGIRAPISSLFTSSGVVCAYIGSGLQIFCCAVLFAWLPSYFNRYHHLAADKAGAAAAMFVLLSGSGLIICGIITDRVGRSEASRKWDTAIVYCAISLVCLSVGFRLGTGVVSLVLIGCGAFFCAGSSGPIAAMVANLTHRSVHASAMGTLTLANNLLGLALGPLVVGMLADHIGLLKALQLAPVTYLAAIGVLLIGRRRYPDSARRLAALTESMAGTNR